MGASWRFVTGRPTDVCAEAARQAALRPSSRHPFPEPAVERVWYAHSMNTTTTPAAPFDRTALPEGLRRAPIVDRPAPRVWVMRDTERDEWMVVWASDGPAITLLTERTPSIAFRCPECGGTWSTEDDPNEWAYGHDCEA